MTAREAAEGEPFVSELLFTDGLPPMDDELGYRGAVAARAAGITYRQLDYWARTSLGVPSIRGAAGSGSQRLYSFKDILVLKIVKRLLDTGISLQNIRVAVDHLRQRGVEDLARITLFSDGTTVYECTSAEEVVDLDARVRSQQARAVASTRGIQQRNRLPSPTRWLTSPPSMAPGSEPMPPSTAAVKAFTPATKPM